MNNYLHLSFGKYVKTYDMPWLPVLFESKYDAKMLKGDIHIKDTTNYEKYFKYLVFPTFFFLMIDWLFL